MRRLLLSAALLALAATALAAPADAGDDPTAPEVAVGDCFDLTWKQIGGTELPDDVGCGTDHTTMITALHRLPADVDWDDEDAVLDAVRPICRKATSKQVGHNWLHVVRSQYDWAWFGPTRERREAGSRWFSCHLIVRTDTGVGPLPHHPPMASNHLPDSVARCLTRGLDFTTCADRHVWRSSYSFFARGRYTKANVDRAANRVCPSHVSSRHWLRSGWDYLGQRFIVACYSRTPR